MMTLKQAQSLVIFLVSHGLTVDDWKKNLHETLNPQAIKGRVKPFPCGLAKKVCGALGNPTVYAVSEEQITVLVDPDHWQDFFNHEISKQVYWQQVNRHLDRYYLEITIWPRGAKCAN